MLPITPTSELEAVNLMLAAISESPINSLTSPRTPDASIAINLLRETTRSTQARGWSFNTETNFPLPKDGNGNINLPPSVARVMFLPSCGFNPPPIQRGSMVYDRLNHTFVFAKDLKADEMVVFIPFDQMPESARHYVALKAARRFTDTVQGSSDQHQYTAQEELTAYNDMCRDDSLNDSLNILTGPSTWPTASRLPYHPHLW